MRCKGLLTETTGRRKTLMSNWRNINGAFTIRFVSLPLALAFSNGDEFLHVRVWPSPDREDLG